MCASLCVSFLNSGTCRQRVPRGGDSSTDSETTPEKTAGGILTKSLAEAMTHVHIYSPYWHTLGGGEKYMAQLASALSGIPAPSGSLFTSKATFQESL